VEKWQKNKKKNVEKCEVRDVGGLGPLRIESCDRIFVFGYKFYFKKYFMKIL
jgi:hypothetical protein